MISKLERFKKAIRQTHIAPIPRRGQIEVTFVKELGKNDIIVYNNNSEKWMKYKYDNNRDQFDLKNDKKTILSTVKMESKMECDPPHAEQGRIEFHWNFHYVWTITSPYDSVGQKITYIKIGETAIEYGDEETQTLTGDVMAVENNKYHRIRNQIKVVQYFDKNLSMEKIDENNWECEGIFNLERTSGIIGSKVKVTTKSEDTLFGLNCGFVGMQILEAEKETTDRMNKEFAKYAPKQDSFSFREIFKRKPVVAGRLNMEAKFDDIHEQNSPFKRENPI